MATEERKEKLKKNYQHWISNPDNKEKRKKYNHEWAQTHKAERAAYMREYRRKQKAVQTATDDVSATENKENSD